MSDEDDEIPQPTPFPPEGINLNNVTRPNLLHSLRLGQHFPEQDRQQQQQQQIQYQQNQENQHAIILPPVQMAATATSTTASATTNDSSPAAAHDLPDDLFDLDGEDVHHRQSFQDQHEKVPPPPPLQLERPSRHKIIAKPPPRRGTKQSRPRQGHGTKDLRNHAGKQFAIKQGQHSLECLNDQRATAVTGDLNIDGDNGYDNASDDDENDKHGGADNIDLNIAATTLPPPQLPTRMLPRKRARLDSATTAAMAAIKSPKGKKLIYRNDVTINHQPGYHPPANDRPKKSRKRYANSFKAKVITEMQQPESSLHAVAKKYEIPETTIRTWNKSSNAAQIESSLQRSCGKLKANLADPLNRLSESLLIFFERNAAQPDYLRLDVTTRLVMAKGLEIKQNLLELDEIQPFLGPKEKKMLEGFTSSISWAKKFAQRHNLKMTHRMHELTDTDVKRHSQDLHEMRERLTQAGPAYDEVVATLHEASLKLAAAFERAKEDKRNR